MLVLMRRPNEIITIGDSITVTVISVRGQNVKIGINAPGEYKIMRAELTSDMQYTQVTHWIVQLSSNYWLGDKAEDGYAYAKDRREAYKFATEAEAGAALIAERRIANWAFAAVNKVEAR